MRVERSEGRITRRGFLELSSAALATVGLKGVADAAECSPNPQSAAEMAKPDAASTTGKIALEEHFGLPESANYAGKDLPTEEDRANFFDVGSRRIADMDRGGLEICVLSPRHENSRSVYPNESISQLSALA